MSDSVNDQATLGNNCPKTAPSHPSFFTTFERFILPEPNSGCWLWTSTATPPGYGWFRRSGKMIYAHRAAYEASTGQRVPVGLVVRHSCDTPSCVNPDHLSVGTKADNGRDMRERGRSLLGSKNINAKVTEDEARTIIRLAHAGVTQPLIAQKFNIDQSAVSYLKTGRRWPHLKGVGIVPKTKPDGMLIDDAQIVERVGQERAIGVLEKLDADPHTARYEPIYKGRRYRPQVEKKLAELSL